MWMALFCVILLFGLQVVCRGESDDESSKLSPISSRTASSKGSDSSSSESSSSESGSSDSDSSDTEQDDEERRKSRLLDLVDLEDLEALHRLRYRHTKQCLE